MSPGCSNPKRTLSLCVIVKNEEGFIAQCLNSVKDFVDEIIVVDTGSEDRTVEIAKEYEAKIFVHPWVGDFSVARNHCIDHAASDWILVLDADERLALRDAAQLRDLIQNTTCLGFKLIQRNYLWDARVACSRPTPQDYEEGRNYSNCVDLKVIRLFKNSAEIRYQGRVHELVDPVFESRQLPFLSTDLVIHHYGKVAERNRLEVKKQVYLALGRQKAQEEPGSAMAQYELGIQLFELDRFREAIPYFEAAYRLNPSIDFSQFYLALAYHRLGELQVAGEYYQKCLARNAENDRVLLDYANYFRDLGHLKKALKYYKQCISLNPKNALAFFNMAGVFLRLGKTEEGFTHLAQALRLNPDSEVLCENFARLAIEKRRLVDAIPPLELCSSKFPQNRSCLALLAEIHFKLKHYDQAREWASKALMLDPSMIPLWLIKAHSEFSSGLLPEAEASYQAVLGQDAANLDALMNLASLSEHRGDLEQTESRLREVTNHHPDQPSALKKLAVIQSKRCPDHSAMTFMERAFQANPQDTECLLLLGYLYEKNAGPERAIKFYERILTDNPRLARLAREKIRRLTHCSETVKSANADLWSRGGLGSGRNAQEPLNQRISNNESSGGFEIINKPEEERNATT